MSVAPLPICLRIRNLIHRRPLCSLSTLLTLHLTSCQMQGRQKHTASISPFWCLLSPDLAVGSRSQGPGPGCGSRASCFSPVPLTAHGTVLFTPRSASGLQRTQRGLGNPEGDTRRSGERDSKATKTSMVCLPGLGPSQVPGLEITGLNLSMWPNDFPREVRAHICVKSVLGYQVQQS